MGTRGFVSVAALNAIAGLLLGAFLLAERPSLPNAAAPAAPKETATGPAVQDPPTWAHQVLDKANGNWTVSWAEVSRYLNQYTFDPNQGEKDHKMLGSTPVFASIFPARDVWRLEYNRLFGGQVIARIESTDQYSALGLIKGNNYLFVWKTGTSRRMAVLNEAGRREVKLHYERHGDVTQDFARDILTERAPNPGRLSISALTCIAKGWKACFVDSQDIQILPGGDGPMMSRGEAQGGGGSQPWVACVLYGCCCGGVQCHKD